MHQVHAQQEYVVLAYADTCVGHAARIDAF
jgi:hypothetical protein